MRKRLAIAIAGVAAAAVVLFALPFAVALRQTYRDEDLIRLQRDTVAATRSIDLGSSGHDPVELPSSHDSLAVYDLSGRKVAGRGPVRASGSALRALRSGRVADQVVGGRLMAAVPLLHGERVNGVLLAERSGAAASQDTHRAWLALAAGAAVIVAIAIAAALLLGRRLARPLEVLAACARRLGHGDFSVRTPRSSIPEVDAVAEALDATAARLEDLVSRERTFSADASHQLRTPLAALRIELEAMEMAIEGAGPGSADLTPALKQVDRLEETIATLLEVARDVYRAPGRTDLVTLIDELAGEWHGRLAADNRPLRTRIDSEHLVARASAPVLRQVLRVLIENAELHGGGAVTISARRREEWLVVDFADDGPGFEGDPEAAFERRGPGEGHGIGLSLARSLAHAEGGRLYVSSPGPHPVLTLVVPAASP
jgi:signal transduction histidine kinase